MNRKQRIEGMAKELGFELLSINVEGKDSDYDTVQIEKATIGKWSNGALVQVLSGQSDEVEAWLFERMGY